MVLSIYFNKFLARVFKSPVSDLTSGFIVGNKSRFKRFFEKSNYGEYFIYLIKDLINDNVTIEEVSTFAKQEYMVFLKQHLVYTNL